MKIDSQLAAMQNADLDATRKVDKPGNKQASGVRASASGADVDSVDLSQAGKLEQTLASLPEIRQAKVDALQRAIACGAYTVSDSDLADAMLADRITV